MSRLLDELREAIRVRHYSIRTEEAYIGWARQFILFHGKRHPLDMGEPEVKDFLTHLAVDRKVAASTQNQALSSLLFLYKAVLDRPLGDFGEVVRARRPERLPVVMTREKIKAVLVERASATSKSARSPEKEEEERDDEPSGSFGTLDPAGLAPASRAASIPRTPRGPARARPVEGPPMAGTIGRGSA